MIRNFLFCAFVVQNTSPLSQYLIETDPRGHGDIQALDRSQHGKPHQQIASFPGQAAQPLAFSAQDQRERAGEVGLEQAGCCLCGRADQPDTPLFETRDGAR